MMKLMVITMTVTYSVSCNDCNTINGAMDVKVSTVHVAVVVHSKVKSILMATAQEVHKIYSMVGQLTSFHLFLVC